MSVCSICIETYSRSRVPIQCLSCEFVSCNTCVKTYLMGSSKNPGCMNCKKEWDRSFLSKNFSKSFLNTTLKKKREDLLFDREKALLPATQPFVEAIIHYEELTKEMETIRTKIRELESQYRTLGFKRESLEINNPNVPRETRVFIKSCPSSDCKGFLSTNWTCGLCHNKTCRECHEIEDEEHKCDPSNVETAKLLSADTKSCPNCGTQIFKIEGCDQMFCTQCHTPFSWRTGMIENGHIHNPHYFEWLRKNPGQHQLRNVNDIQCGRDMNHFFIHGLITRLTYNGVDTKYIDSIVEICRNIIHLREIEVPRYRVNAINNNRDLRIRYMRNQISETELKRSLQKREKEMDKKTNISNVLQMIISCVIEIVYRIFDEPLKYMDFLMEFNQLILYSNECLKDISTIYNSARLKFTSKLELKNSTK